MKNEIEIGQMFIRRRGILNHNNNYILEIIIFYEQIMLSEIIIPYIIKDEAKDLKNLSKFFQERMNIMDKYKIVCDIARKFNIDIFKDFDYLIKVRNKIAHNRSFIGMYNSETGEQEIVFGGQETTWEKYKKTLEKWSKSTLDFAKFIKNIYEAINPGVNVPFEYCKLEFGYILQKYNIIASLELEETEYISYADNEDIFHLFNKTGENEYSATNL